MVNLSLYNRFWGHLAQKLIKIKFLDSGIHYSPIFADKVSKEAGTAGRQKSSYFSDIKHFGFMFFNAICVTLRNRHQPGLNLPRNLEIVSRL